MERSYDDEFTLKREGHERGALIQRPWNDRGRRYHGICEPSPVPAAVPAVPAVPGTPGAGRGQTSETGQSL